MGQNNSESDINAKEKSKGKTPDKDEKENINKSDSSTIIKKNSKISKHKLPKSIHALASKENSCKCKVNMLK